MFSDPSHNIEQLGLSDGMVVADLGAGSGYYSIEAARAVAPTGRVYAIDISIGMLERLKSEARNQHVRGVEIVAGDLEKLGGSKLRESSCDVAIASNILFMIEGKKDFILEAKRILKPKGRLLLIDWAGSFGQIGPHADHVIYKDDAVKLCKAAGLSFDREISAGSHHYGIIFRKDA